MLASLTISAIGDFAPGPIRGVQFSRLAAPSMALPPPPRFTFGPFPPSLMAKYYGLWGLGSVGVFSLQEFELSGAFLLRANDTYYRCPELNVHEKHIQEEVERIGDAQMNPHREHLRGSHVLLAGPGYRVYGHWLVEYLPKISLLNFAGYDLQRLRYLLPVTTPSYVFSWLDLLGIKSDQIVRYDPDTDVITADEFLLPTILHNGLRMSPIFNDASAFMRGLIGFKNDLQGSTYGSRIFLARPHGSQSRALGNRARIQELASQSNFIIVNPETLSLLDQVRLFVGAREIMGEYGSALHASMFSSAGTVVCALRGTGDHPGLIQSGMGHVLQQPTGYVFGEADDSKIEFGFRIDEETFKTALKLIFNSRLPL